MQWFVIALAGPFLWAIVNHIDKYLLLKYFKERSTGTLMLFSTLISVIVLPILYLIEPNIFNISFINAVILIGVGVLSVFAVWLYLEALSEDEVSIVVPLFQTVPIFGALFAFIFLKETLSWEQTIGCALIIIGSAIITLELDEERKVKFKKKVLLLMLASSAVFGFYETLFKVAAINEPFWVSAFWEHVGLFFVGICLLSVPRLRKEFLLIGFRKSGRVFSLNILSEVMTVIGNIVTNYALLIAPVALVLGVTGIQPLLVFIIGALFTILFPKYISEKITKKHLIQKLLSVGLLFIGVFMLH